MAAPYLPYLNNIFGRMFGGVPGTLPRFMPRDKSTDMQPPTAPEKVPASGELLSFDEYFRQNPISTTQEMRMPIEFEGEMRDPKLVSVYKNYRDNFGSAPTGGGAQPLASDPNTYRAFPERFGTSDRPPPLPPDLQRIARRPVYETVQPPPSVMRPLASDPGVGRVRPQGRGFPYNGIFNPMYSGFGFSPMYGGFSPMYGGFSPMYGGFNPMYGGIGSYGMNPYGGSMYNRFSMGIGSPSFGYGSYGSPFGSSPYGAGSRGNMFSQQPYPLPYEPPQSNPYAGLPDSRRNALTPMQPQFQQTNM